MPGFSVKAPASGQARLPWLHRLRHLWLEPAQEHMGPPVLKGAEAIEVLPAALCVLVADDNPGNLMLASEMLGHFGIKSLLAADGAEAVAVAAENRLDLILMDLQMPVLGGLGATRQIRRFEREQHRARVPVVAYTSLVGGGLRLSDHGVDDLLEKPCELRAMHECLLRWCPPHGGFTEQTAAP